MKHLIPIILILSLMTAVCGPGCNPVVGTDGQEASADPAGAPSILAGETLIKPTTRREVQTWYNCLIVEEAVKKFSEQSGGLYPWTLADRTPGGDTVIDLLPGGKLLKNAFYLCQTEPIDGAAAWQGQVGYMVIARGGRAIGYCITGWGIDRMIACIFNEPAEYAVSVDLPGFNPDGTPITANPADPVDPPPPVEEAPSDPDPGKSVFEMQH